MNTETTSTRLRKLGIDLPPVPRPLASYVSATRAGTIVYAAGQLPLLGGKLTATGHVGVDLSIEEAAHAARLCAINAVAAVAEIAGGVDNIAHIVKVVGFVASRPTFTDQPAVVDGASAALVEIFGDLKGRHARSAVGVAALPRNAAVEIEIIAELTD